MLNKLIILLFLNVTAVGQFYSPLQKPDLGIQINWGRPVTDGLVAAYFMNEGSGNKAFDLSGNGNHGTITNALWVPGKFGPVLSFDGSGDYVDVGRPPHTNRITVSAWVTTNTASPSADTIAGRDDDTNRAWSMYMLNNTTLRFFIFIGNTVKIKDHTITLATNTWYHLVGVYDGANVRIYVNGVDVGTPTAATGNIDNDPVNTQIGCDLNTVHISWSGLIDLPMIFNRGLSPSEIAKLYREPFCFMEPSFDLMLYGAISIPVGGGQVIIINMN